MKENYIIAEFRQTAAKRFPAQAETLNAALDRRLDELRREHSGDTKEKKEHLESQILPGIAAYEVLQTVMPKEEARQTVHDYVERRAWKLKAMIQKLMRLPGFYRLVPDIFAKGTRKMFGETAGFAAVEHETNKNVWRIDMVKCPYHDTCVEYNCPELCPCFCDSDDITYDGLHPKLIWHRTKTLGRGNDCCDFDLHVKKS